MAAVYGSMEASVPPTAGGTSRKRHLAALVAGVCLCTIVAIGVHGSGLSSSLKAAHSGTQMQQMLWGGDNGVNPSAMPAAPSARRSQLADFEPAKLYKDPPSTDLDHANRIDNYGCMFSDCEGSKTPLLKTVNRLKRLLGKLDAAQQKFIKDLEDKPVQTTMKVTMGEPGRLGARGNRGPVGPDGPRGVTGPQGRTGFIGETGLPGVEGDRGETGPPGYEGPQGRQGVKGDRGPVGPRGVQGNKGNKGETGPPGYQGDNGPAGQDGQKGGPGKPGSAPAGPPGPPGPTGTRGPKGDKGAKGNRGPEGAPGNAGPQGIPGIKGNTGGFGKDGKTLPVPQCLGQTSTRGKTICHGWSNVDWNSYYSTAAYLDVNTEGCKFDTDNVQYFTFITGNGHNPELTGASAIFSPTKNGFRVYITTDVNHQAIEGWKANQYRLRLGWVGVGSSSGPKTTAVCCGTGEHNWGSYYAYGVQAISAAACQMKGAPVWITAAEGGKGYGTSEFLGTNSAYNVGASTAAMYVRQSDPAKDYWGYFNGALLSSGASVLSPKYCLFGEPFPSGDQRLDSNEITKDEYPCDGMRVVAPSQTVVTNTAGMCCGKSSSDWTLDEKKQLSMTVDTSSCNFKNNNVVYITSLGGSAEHWRVTGSTAYSESSSTMFVTKLLYHPSQTTAARAKELEWVVNWCGIGDAGNPSEPAPPAPPSPPTPTPPTPSPPKAEEAMTDTGINTYCKNWRDRDKKTLREQMQFFAYCMEQDCMQSMEKISCRYTDENGFCYTDAGQTFCSKHPGHSKCKDLGVAAMSNNLDGAGTWEPIKDKPTYDNSGKLQTSEPHFHCACWKKCVFNKDQITSFRCDQAGGGPIKVGQLSGTPLEDETKATIIKDSNKKDSCACVCCFSSNGDCYDKGANKFNKCDGWANKDPSCAK